MLGGRVCPRLRAGRHLLVHELPRGIVHLHGGGLPAVGLGSPAGRALASPPIEAMGVQTGGADGGRKEVEEVPQDQFIARLPEGERARFLRQKGATVFEPMPGRPMKEYVRVPPTVLDDDAALAGWLRISRAYVEGLPPKAKKASKGAKKAPAPRPARSTPSVSPLRGMSVDDWLKKKVQGWQAEVVEDLLAIVRRAAPAATASIKWAQPVFEQGGPVAFIKVAKAHVTFGFWRGAELSAPRGVLQGGQVMRHLKIKSADEVDEELIARLVKQAVALNRTKGDPTARHRSSR